jgi:hypothetical protein
LDFEGGAFLKSKKIGVEVKKVLVFFWENRRESGEGRGFLKKNQKPKKSSHSHQKKPKPKKNQFI